MFGKLKEDVRAYSIANKSSAPVERMMTALHTAIQHQPKVEIKLFFGNEPTQYRKLYSH